MPVAVELVGVRVDVPSNTPVVLLRELAGERRMLAIMIGHPEAHALSFVLDGVEPRRPLTHDLIRLLLEELGASIEQIVVSALEGNIFYSDIVLRLNGDTHVVSARPSDAVNIAVRTATPMFVNEAVLDEAGYLPEEEEDEEEDEADADDVVEQFREFIDHVNPEDFAS